MAAACIIALGITALITWPWLWLVAGAAVPLMISFTARKHMKDPPRQG
jgi:divalent metal cation (Fe/Co/Zn/Cd) transporter